MKFALTFCLLILIFSKGWSQHDRCGTEHYHQQKEEKNPDLIQKKEKFNQLISESIATKKSAKIAGATLEEEIYRIPVVVHIVHDNGDAKNVTDEQVYSQILVLNQDFRKMAGTPGENNEDVAADTKIEFCLATRDPYGNYTSGITRTYNSKSSFSQSQDDAYLKSLAYWPSDQYLNIWVCNLSNNVIGYAQFPHVAYGTGVNGLSGVTSDAYTDGVVLDYTAFGTTGTAKFPYNKGKSATHEVGHWLGLFHIWGESSSGCGTDYVDDTPPDEEPNYNSTCLDSSHCFGVASKDQANNYMDYSPDVCLNLYTHGQKDRMRAVMELNSRRKALRTSPGCCGAGIATALPLQEGFETDNGASTGWTIINKGGNIWKRVDHGAYNESDWSLAISTDGKFSGDTTTSADYDLLESTFVDFAYIRHPFITFDLAYAGEGGGKTDSLVLSYNIACTEWEPIATFSGNSLITTSRTTKNFTPNSDEWKNIAVDLSVLGGKKLARLRFERYSNRVNTVYLDNINIYESTDQLAVTAFPVPASDNVKFKITFKDIKDIKVLVYSAIGQVIEEKDVKGTRSLVLDYMVSNLSDGIYFVKIIEGENSAVTRFLISR